MHTGPRLSLVIVPTTLDAANAFVKTHHRHHKPDRGHKFSVAVHGSSGLCGVAIVGRPSAPALDKGLCAEVTRTCTDGTANANSCLYGAAWRTASGMGYRRMVTYTELGESGISLRAAGWRRTAVLPPRPNWAASSKKLKHLRDPDGRGNVWRFRWEIGPDAAPAITVDKTSTLCEDTAMPRKKKTDVAPPAAAPTIEEQLESVTWATEQGLASEEHSVAARLRNIGQLVAAADAAGVEVPLAVRNRVPTQEEIIADYKRKAQLATAAKNEAEYLRDRLLETVDASYAADPDGDFERFDGGTFELVRTPGFNERIDKTKLIELGVDPDIVDRATVVSPYYYWLVKERKAATP